MGSRQRATYLAVAAAVSAVGMVLPATAQTSTPPATAGPATGTVRPELVGSNVGVTTTNSSTPPSYAQTTINYTFNKPVTGASPVAADFHLVGFNANLRFDGQGAAVESDGQSVLVTFGTPSAPVGAQQILDTSIAAVGEGAVTGAGNLTNPIGAVPEGSTRTVANSAGVTAAPDLKNVGNFQAPPSTSLEPTSTLVDFTFDKPAWPTSGGTGPPAPHLVLQNGTQLTCTWSSGSGTKTLTATCPNPTDPTTGLLPSINPISAAQVARGYVDAEAVSADPQDAAVSAPQGSVNPLQSVDVSGPGTTPTPYLKGVLYMPNVAVKDSYGHSLKADQVGYVFDQPVNLGTAAGGNPPCTIFSSAIPDGACFLLFTGDARQISAANKTQSDFTESDFAVEGNPPRVDPDKPNEVIATFPAGSLASAAGAAVATGAVTETSAAKAANAADEFAEAYPGHTVFSPGVTDGPLLASVTINTPASAVTVTYVFDQDLQPPTNGMMSSASVAEFSLFDADGTQLQCQAATQATGGAPGTNNTVTCTQFLVIIAGGGTATGSQISQAVVGTVDHAAVTNSNGADPTVPNPEDAVLAAGGSGTPDHTPSPGSARGYTRAAPYPRIRVTPPAYRRAQRTCLGGCL